MSFRLILILLIGAALLAAAIAGIVLRAYARRREEGLGAFLEKLPVFFGFVAVPALVALVQRLLALVLPLDVESPVDDLLTVLLEAGGTVVGMAVLCLLAAGWSRLRVPMIVFGALLALIGGAFNYVEVQSEGQYLEWMILAVVGLTALVAGICWTFSDVLRRHWLALALLFSFGHAVALGAPQFIGMMILFLVTAAALFGVFALVRERYADRGERTAVVGNVVFVAEIALALVVAANDLAGSWLTATIGSFDSTETKVYSLGDRTRKMLEDLPGTVHATYMEFGSTYRAMPGEEPLGSRGKDFLRQYADYSPKVAMKTFNAVQDKTEAEEWLRGLGITDFDLEDQDTVIFTHRPPGAEKPNRKDVKVASWSFLETSPLGTKKFKGEQLFTSAIQDVIFEKRKVYFLKGHGEPSLHGGGRELSFGEAAEIVRRLALEAESLSLVEKGRVPEDADLIVIGGPRGPLLAEEKEMLVRYLDGGGSLILMLDPDVGLLGPGAEPARLGLEEYLKGLGIVPRTDLLVMDYDLAVGTTGEGRFQKTDSVLTADYAYHDIVSDLSRTGFACRFIQACPVMVDRPEDDEGLSVEELIYARRSPGLGLLTYGAKLFPGRDPGGENPTQDLIGERLPIGVAAERKPAEEGAPGPVTRVVVFGDSEFATSVGLSTQSRFFAPGNASLLANAVSWAVKRESLISIEPKTLETETVALSERDQRLSKAVGMFLIPFSVLAFAVGVWWRRRR